MSRTDKLDRNIDRKFNAEIIGGALVCARPRNALIPSAAQAIAEQLDDAQESPSERLIDELNSFDRYMDCDAASDPALVSLFSRPRRIDAPKPRIARPSRPRVQNVLPSTFIASEGRVPRIGANRGKHHADLDAGGAPSLAQMAKARAKALGL